MFRWPRFASSSLIGLLALAAGFSGGWLVRDHSQSEKIYSHDSAKNKRLPSRTDAKNTGIGPARVAWDLNGPLADILRKYTGGARIVAMAKLVEQTPVSDLHHLLDQIAISPQADIRPILADLVYAKWVVSDPNGALGYANEISSRSTKSNGVADLDALNSVFAAWAGVEPQAALAAAQKLGHAYFRETETNQVFSNWLENGDPAAAFAALKGLGNGSIGGSMARVFFEQWSRVDPRAAWAALDQIDLSSTRNAATNLIIRNMAASDPEGAFELFRSSSSAMTNVNTYTQLFQTWAAQDPTTALFTLEQLPVGDARTQALAAIFKTWGQSDPVAALQAAQSLPLGINRDVAIEQGFSGLALQDPQAAADYVSSLPEGNFRDSLLNPLFATWSSTDPAATLAWLDKNPSKDPNHVLLALANLSLINPQAAFAYITQMPIGIDRSNSLKYAATTWANRDPSAAIAWAKGNLTGDDQTQALVGVAASLSDSNRAAAANLIAQLPEGSVRNNAITVLAGKWAAADVVGAAQWLQSLPADASMSDLSLAYQDVVHNWAKTDPAAAAAYVQSLPPGVNLGNEARSIASSWAKQDLQAALNWVVSLPVGKARDDAVSAAVGYWADTDPAGAFQYVQSLPPTDSTTYLLASVVSTWSYKDAATAASMLVVISPEALNQPEIGSAGESITTNWAKKDIPAATQWALTLPQGILRDSAIRGLTSVLMYQEPAKSFQLALTINDQAKRTAAIRTIFPTWYQVDSSSATAALHDAPIVPADRDRLLLNAAAMRRQPQEGQTLHR